MSMTRISLSLAAAGLMSASLAQAGEVEVLHWWTSGGEAKAAAELKATMQKKGHTWKDFAVAGGGGDSAMTVLKSRVVSGNAPAAAQIKGPSLQEWAREGVLANMDGVAKAEKWDELLPKAIADGLKYKGNYIAAPVNVHRVNWLWANPEVFKKAGAKLPTTWDEFFVAAEALKKAGVIPVAHGGQNWQDFTTFESVALGVGGADFYKKALVQLDAGSLKGATMQKVLETFKKVKGYTDKNAPGRDWNLATAMVIKGEAGMQLIGDWAKGEFLAAGKVPGKDFACVAGDVSNIDDCKKMVADAEAAAGPVDILVNNAGITRDNLTMRMGDDEWDAVIDTNLKAVFRLSRGVMRGMMKARFGRIVNITSVVGYSGNPGQANYCAAKAGVAGMSRSLARELGSRNITVNCVAPGFIATDMTHA